VQAFSLLEYRILHCTCLFTWFWICSHHD